MSLIHPTRTPMAILRLGLLIGAALVLATLATLVLTGAPLSFDITTDPMLPEWPW